jgi:hypothetical protein
MRFYDPSSTPPERVDSQQLFPKSTPEEACQRCLKLGLLPSVTSVLAILRQEHIEKWKMGEAIRNYQRHGNARMAVEEHFSKDSKESQFGTRVHDAVHRFTQNQPIEDEAALNHALPLIEWLRENECQVLLSEATLACQKTGTAGTIDLLLRDKTQKKILGDIKVVKMSPRFEKIPPLNYRCQLSAYERMLLQQDPEPIQRVSFYLASAFGEDKIPQLTVFRYKEDYYPEFQACLALWHAQYGPKYEKPQKEEKQKHLPFNPFDHR